MKVLMAVFPAQHINCCQHVAGCSPPRSFRSLNAGTAPDSQTRGHGLARGSFFLENERMAKGRAHVLRPLQKGEGGGRRRRFTFDALSSQPNHLGGDDSRRKRTEKGPPCKCHRS